MVFRCVQLSLGYLITFHSFFPVQVLLEGGFCLRLRDKKDIKVQFQFDLTPFTICIPIGFCDYN